MHQLIALLAIENCCTCVRAIVYLCNPVYMYTCVTCTAFDIEEVIDSADSKLFTCITQPGHCLYHLIPPKTSAYCPYSLRKRQHSHRLPRIEISQYKNSFINRSLFKFI